MVKLVELVNWLNWKAHLSDLIIQAGHWAIGYGRWAVLNFEF